MLPSAAASARRSRGVSRRFLILAIAYLSFMAVVLPLLARRWIPRWRSVEVARWPRVARIDVELDLARPPEFAARGRYTFDDVRTRQLPFLLNRALEVVSARDADGRELAVEHGRKLRSAYHSEGRVVTVDLGRDPAAEGERVELELSWRGTGDDGTSGRDWRGILLLADDELRASDQTIALPAIPVDAGSPAHMPTPGRVQVILPRDFEIYLPGLPREPTITASADTRVECFELSEGAQVGFVAGRYVKQEIQHDGLRLVSLMKEEHAELGPELLAEALRAVAFYTARFGPVRGEALGVCEILGRGSSYNWAGYGMVVFERGALGGGVPREKVGHEVAHLWFGQAVRATGPGERFLTEGLAEYASWRWLEECEGPAAARTAAREAREEWLDAVHERGADPALAEVGFATPDYTVLAYSKGALVARAAEHALGRDVFDARLAAYVREHAERPATLERFAVALAGPDGRAGELVPWLTHDGHAHLALADVAWDPAARRVDGRVEPVPCPEDLDGPGGGAVLVRASGDVGAREVEVELAGDRRFSVELEEEPAVLAIDPAAAAPAAPGEPLVLRSAMLVRSRPADGAQDVPYELERIELEFDRPLAPLGEREGRLIRRAVYRAADAQGLDYPPVRGAELLSGGRLLVLHPSSAMRPGREQLLAIVGILADVAGAPVDVSIRFRTRASGDHEPPRVVACEPDNGAAGVDPALAEIRITFSEPMNPGRGYKTDHVSAQERRGVKFPLGARGDSRWTEDRRTLIYELGLPLAPGTRYGLPLRFLFRDTASNELEPFDYEFTTR